MLHVGLCSDSREWYVRFMLLNRPPPPGLQELSDSDLCRVIIQCGLRTWTDSRSVNTDMFPVSWHGVCIIEEGH